MQLKDYQIPRESIPLAKGQSFDVRGLCADDLTFLISQHHGPITRAIKRYQESRNEIAQSKNLSAFILALVQDFPDLVAEVISAASDSLDDETRKVAKQLPITTQIIALNAIVKLSADDVADIKNLLAEMRERLQSLAGAGNAS